MTITPDYSDEQIGEALFQLGYENVTNEARPVVSGDMLEEAKSYLWHEEQGDFDPCAFCKRPAMHCICP